MHTENIFGGGLTTYDIIPPTGDSSTCQIHNYHSYPSNNRWMLGIKIAALWNHTFFLRCCSRPLLLTSRARMAARFDACGVMRCTPRLRSEKLLSRLPRYKNISGRATAIRFQHKDTTLNISYYSAATLTRAARGETLARFYRIRSNYYSTFLASCA